jgi:uncharacterized protein (TIGR03437 family)
MHKHGALSLAIFGALLLGLTDTAAAQNNTLLVSSTSLSFTFQTGAAAPPPQSLSLVSSGASLAFNASASTVSGGNWLSIGATHGATPATLSVSVNPSGLATGSYQGAITITSGGASDGPITVPVSLTVTSSSQLTFAPSSLSFSFQVGGATPPNQSLSVGTTGSPLNVTVTGTAAGGQWLLLAPLTGTTPAAINVGVNPAGLAPGTYNGAVNIAAGGAANSPVSVPVTLTVSANPQLMVSPSSLQFNFQTGGAAPANQILSVTSSGSSALSFAAISSTNSGGNWLVPATFSGTTPASFTVAVNPSGLAPGTYTGSITLTSSGASNAPVTVPVTLIVSSNPLLGVSPSTLAFNFQTGLANPANQTLTVTSTGAAVNFSVSSATSGGGNWLFVGPLTGATTGTVIVAVNPSGLAPGTYNGSITLTSASTANLQTVPVTLVVSNNPLLTISPPALSFGFQTGTAVPAPQTVSVNSTGAPLTYTLTATTSSGGNWLAVTPNGGTTPSSFSVAVNPVGLAVGSYSGSITISANAAGNSPQTLSVTLVVSNTALIVASPQSLTFNSAGGVNVPIQNISLTSTDSTPVSFSVSAGTSAGGNWLLVGPLSGTTPSNLNVGVNPVGLSPGTYNGSVTITAPAAPNSPQTVAVSLTITSTISIAVAPASLSFSQVAGGQPPAAQTLAVSSSGGALGFTATASTNNGGGWLSVAPAGGTTPSSLTVSANGLGLSPGTYTGSVTIVATAAGNSPQTIPVTLVVTGQQALFVSPAGLTFNFQIGGSAPPAQTVSVSAAGGANLNFTAAAATTTGVNWLSVTPATGATPASLSVSVNPTGLQAGTYSGSITINSPSSANGAQTVNVTLAVTAAPPPSPVIISVVNAASFAPTAAAPGEVITIFGSGIGPATPAGGHITSGTLDNLVGGTQVLFDGIPAPLLYVSSTQINAVVPYEIEGRFSTQLQVAVQGTLSAPVSLRVVDTAPGIFTVNATGSGQGAILNQNFSLNGPANPAARASVVMIYATGEGQTNPLGVDGLITGNLLRHPRQAVSVTIGGQPADVVYAGSAPGFVSGALQVNARIPNGVAPGSAVPVVLTIGNASSQAGVTIAVQ